MTNKTNVLLHVTEHNGPHRPDNVIEPHCRVKLDSLDFPYIAVQDQRFTLSSFEFPQKLGTWGDHWATIDYCVDGLDELKQILSNPDLTVDKLSMKQLGRVTYA